jgi:SAM-dependent methyltransferase
MVVMVHFWTIFYVSKNTDRNSSIVMSTPKTPKSKLNEINYIENLSKVRGIPSAEVEEYHLRKPFTDNRRGWYLMDLGQIMKLLPDPPARLLDLGIGSGWTSKYLALSGYQVVGLDIAPSMIKLAETNCAGLENIDLHACDYELGIDFGSFDSSLIYDALHHATNEASLLKNVYNALKPGGRLVTAEPGRGHSQSENTRQVVEDFGVTERDMEFSRQKQFMAEAGFSEIRQYYRLSELGLEDVSTEGGRTRQIDRFADLYGYTLEAGFSSIVVAIK